MRLSCSSRSTRARGVALCAQGIQRQRRADERVGGPAGSGGVAAALGRAHGPDDDLRRVDGVAELADHVGVARPLGLYAMAREHGEHRRVRGTEEHLGVRHLVAGGVPGAEADDGLLAFRGVNAFNLERGNAHDGDVHRGRGVAVGRHGQAQRRRHRNRQRVRDVADLRHDACRARADCARCPRERIDRHDRGIERRPADLRITDLVARAILRGQPQREHFADDLGIREAALVRDQNSGGPLPHFDANAVRDAAIGAAYPRGAVGARGDVTVVGEHRDAVVERAAGRGPARDVVDRVSLRVAHADAQRRLRADGVQPNDLRRELELRGPLIHDDERGRRIAAGDRPEAGVAGATRHDDALRRHARDRGVTDAPSDPAAGNGAAAGVHHPTRDGNALANARKTEAGALETHLRPASRKRREEEHSRRQAAEPHTHCAAATGEITRTVRFSRSSLRRSTSALNVARTSRRR